MSPRAAVAVGLLLAVGIAVPASAAIQQPVTVNVRHDQHGVGVGTGIGHQPLVGAYTYDGRACAGLSYEVPFCVNTVQP